MDDFFHDPEPQSLDPPEDQTYRFSDAGGQIVRNEALTRQPRNLLLLSPLFQFEHSKARLGPEGESLMDGLDTLYLSLSLLDFVSGRTTAFWPFRARPFARPVSRLCRIWNLRCSNPC